MNANPHDEQDGRSDAERALDAAERRIFELEGEVLSLRRERNALEACVKRLRHEVAELRDGDEATQAWLDAEQAAEDARNGGGR